MSNVDVLNVETPNKHRKLIITHIEDLFIDANYIIQNLEDASFNCTEIEVDDYYDRFEGLITKISKKLMQVDCELLKLKYERRLENVRRFFDEAHSSFDQLRQRMMNDEKQCLLPGKNINYEHSSSSNDNTRTSYDTSHFSELNNDFEQDRVHRLSEMHTKMRDSQEIIEQLHRLANQQDEDFDLLEKQTFQNYYFSDKTVKELELSKASRIRYYSMMAIIIFFVVFCLTVAFWAFVLPIFNTMAIGSGALGSFLKMFKEKISYNLRGGKVLLHSNIDIDEVISGSHVKEFNLIDTPNTNKVNDNIKQNENIQKKNDAENFQESKPKLRSLH